MKTFSELFPDMQFTANSVLICAARTRLDSFRNTFPEFVVDIHALKATAKLQHREVVVVALIHSDTISYRAFYKDLDIRAPIYTEEFSDPVASLLELSTIVKQSTAPITALSVTA